MRFLISGMQGKFGANYIAKLSLYQALLAINPLRNEGFGYIPSYISWLK